MQIICNKPFLSVHLTDVVQGGVQSPAEDGQDDLDNLIHNGLFSFHFIGGPAHRRGIYGIGRFAEQVGVFCISLSTDLSGSMGVSYRELLTKSWTVRNDFVNKRCIFQFFTLCSRFAHAIFTVLAFGPLS